MGGERVCARNDRIGTLVLRYHNAELPILRLLDGHAGERAPHDQAFRRRTASRHAIQSFTVSAGRTTESANERRSSRARWARAVGILIGLVGTAFVVRVLVQNREEVGTATANADWVPLVGAFIAACLGMTGIGLAWRAALRTLGARLGVLSSLRGYFVGQLGKYVPGGVWVIMGRGEWARAEGVGGPVAYSSVLLSMGSAYLAAILLSATLMPFARILGSSGELRLLLVLLLLPLGFALIH